MRSSAAPRRRRISWTLALAASAGAALAGGGPAHAAVGEENNEAQTIKPLSVARLVVARDVAGREPVDASSSFRASEIERLYAFVELVNEAGVASSITVTFTPPGNAPPRRVVLRVGQKRRFRTWAYTKNPHVVGAWTVTVRELGGEALASASFEITP